MEFLKKLSHIMISGGERLELMVPDMLWHHRSNFKRSNEKACLKFLDKELFVALCNKL